MILATAKSREANAHPEHLMDETHNFDTHHRSHVTDGTNPEAKLNLVPKLVPRSSANKHKSRWEPINYPIFYKE